MTLSSSMLLEIETKRRLLLLLSALFIHGFKSIVIIEKSFSRMLLLLLFLLVLDLRVKWRARARLAS
jgi:hypothetical protein